MGAEDEHGGGGKKEREGVDVFSGLDGYLILGLNPNLVYKNICALLYNFRSVFLCVYKMYKDHELAIIEQCPLAIIISLTAKVCGIGSNGRSGLSLGYGYSFFKNKLQPAGQKRPLKHDNQKSQNYQRIVDMAGPLGLFAP